MPGDIGWFSVVHEPSRLESLGGGGNLGRDMGDATGSSKINSSQNGFLLLTTIQQLFNQYLITINPDDGYKVVVFDIDMFGYGGRILDPGCRNPNDPHRVSDQIL
ncbi:hypothetical protein HOY82DRAFT_624886 [Tuber indicum]|nr:hypothetical protein HOY82DRAFT_624886 [Tuber indicum]